MPRVPYLYHIGENAEDAEIIERIRTRRVKAGHDGLVELDRVLFYNRAVANGWNEFLGAVRTGTSLSPDVREFIICRVAVVNGAEYEWGHHAPLLKDALMKELETSEGLSSRDHRALAVAEVVARLRDGRPETWDQFQHSADYVHKNRREYYIVLGRYVDEMTKAVKIADETYRDLRACCVPGPDGEAQMVEITATCAAYNCVSRFLVALNVGDMN